MKMNVCYIQVIPLLDITPKSLQKTDHPQWDVEISQENTWFGAYDPSAYVPEKNKEGVDIDVIDKADEEDVC